MNTKAINTIYNRYGEENIRKCEEYASIIRPDPESPTYKEFTRQITEKVNSAMAWLSERNIEYSWNERINGHLYRLIIPSKDLLFDFEFYPVINSDYNYIRINYDSDIIAILGRLFPEQVFDTQELQVWHLNQKACNKFLRENNTAPIYDNHILRLAFTKEADIYQCMILKQNKVITNITAKNCLVKYGTYMLFRYLNESLEIPEIIIKTNLDNSYTASMYQLLNLPIISKTDKRRIWWSPNDTKWHTDNRDNYIPFYFTENITYKYSK